MNFQSLMQRAGVWRAGELSTAAALPTGFAELDQALPGGGWPQAGLTEIYAQTVGIGALRLVLPALAQLSQQGQWIIWVNPPYVPYSPALHDAGLDLDRLLIVDLPAKSQPARKEILWAYEQALRFSDCAAALVWLDEVAFLHLRRLQLAAKLGATWALVFRPAHFAGQASPAALRLSLQAQLKETTHSGDDISGEQLEVTLFKVRGGRPGGPYRIAL